MFSAFRRGVTRKGASVWFWSSRRITTTTAIVDPVAPLAHPVELARLPLSARQRLRGRCVLGDDVDIDIHAFDETNTRIRPDALIRADRGGRLPAW